jgi:hypothetical protein
LVLRSNLYAPLVLHYVQYGAVTVADAAELNCVTPCGAHGSPAPRATGSGTIGCTCECEDGWATAPNQPFDSFKYCALAKSSGAAGTPEQGTGETLAL